MSVQQQRIILQAMLFDAGWFVAVAVGIWTQVGPIGANPAAWAVAGFVLSGVVTGYRLWRAQQ